MTKHGTAGSAPAPIPHDPRCRCYDCGLDREIDAAFVAAGMVSSAVAVESGRVELETDE
jgi:hypothetical protein